MTNKKKTPGTKSLPPTLCRTGILLLLTDYKMCCATKKNFKEELGKAIDQLKELIDDPTVINAFRKELSI